MLGELTQGQSGAEHYRQGIQAAWYEIWTHAHSSSCGEVYDEWRLIEVPMEI